MPADPPVDGASEFRRRLLDRTLEHARRIDFYQDHWGGHPAGLADLPTVSKRQHFHELESMRCPGLQPALLTQTTGTTGRPFRRCRSQEELEAYAEYVNARLAKSARVSTVRPVVAFNAVPRSIHGAGIAQPQIRHQLAVDLLSEPGAANAIALMSEPSLFQPDQEPALHRILVGAPDTLLAFAVACDLNGVDPGTLCIDELYSVGDLLTPVTRSYLARRWSGSAIRDVFSCSEIVGAAQECEACGGYHFEPLVLPEVLDLDEDRPLESGLGELTLTELFPFSQLQPLVRYRTGDLVRRVECPARPAELGFRLLGRRQSCPAVSLRDRTLVLMGAAELRGILEAEPMVARRSLPGVSHHLVGQLPLGAPIASWEVAVDGDRIRFALAVTATFCGRLHPQAAAELADRVAGRAAEVVDPAGGVRVAMDVRVTDPGVPG